MPIVGTASAIRLYDDTGTLTVVVDERWTDVETHELDIDGGVPRIAATPDEDAFQTDSADATGVNLLAQPFAADPRAVIDQYSRDGARDASSTQPYDDGLRAGLVWLRTGCAASQQGTWSMLVAGPADGSVTLRMQRRTATPADRPAEYIDNFAGGLRTCAADLAADGDSAWATAKIVGDEFTSSDGCADEDPADDFVSLERRGPSDDGCLGMGRVDSEWHIEYRSNSIWRQV